MKKSILSALTNAALISMGFSLSTPAFAGDGLYVTGAFNTTTQENNQSRNTESNAPNEGAAGGPSGTVVDKETNFGFAAGIGYKSHINDAFYISGEAFYSAEDVETTIINNVLTNNVTLNNTYGVDLRFGTDVTDKVSIYGLLGATAFDFDSQIAYTFAPPMDAVSDQVWGSTVGGGVEINFNSRLSTFGEFRLTNDLEFDTPVDQGGVTSQNELNYSVIRTGLRFSF